MARSVSVKIPTSVVIEMIETKLAELNKAETDYPKLLSAYKKDIATFTADLIDLVAKNKKSATEYSDFDFSSGNFAIQSDWRGSVSIQIGKELVSKVGKKPKRRLKRSTKRARQRLLNSQKRLEFLPVRVLQR